MSDNMEMTMAELRAENKELKEENQKLKKEIDDVYEYTVYPDDYIGDGYTKLDGVCECIESGNEFCGELQKEIEKLKEENMGLKCRLKST